MPVSITDSQKFSYTLQEVDKKGQPIPGAPTFDAPPTVTSDNPSVCAATLGADGASIDCVAGVPGTATIAISASIGGNTVGGTDTVTVGVGAAASLNLTAGAPSDQ